MADQRPAPMFQESTLAFPYKHSTGETIGRFLAGLKEQRTIWGQRTAGLGVVVPPGSRVDFGAVMERMRRLRAQISPIDSAWRCRDLGIDVFLGDGRFAGPDTVAVGDARLRFRKAVVATGARPAVPPIAGLAAAGYLTNETVFSLTSLPPRLAVIGGGLLGQLDLSVPYLVRSGLLVAVFAIAYAVMHDIGFEPRRVTVSELPSEIARNARDGVTYGWGQRPLRLLMLASFFQLGFLMWAFYASQPYMLDLLGRDAVWVAGLVTAGIALSTIAGNQLVDVLSGRCGRRTTLLLGAGAVEACAAVALGLVSSFWLALPALS